MINYIGELKHRVEDHVRVGGDEDGSYEPAIVIHNPNLIGRSFIITLPSMWKYMEPSAYKDDERAMVVDREEFDKMRHEVMIKKRKFEEWRVMKGLVQANMELQCCIYAEVFHRAFGIYLCTAFNLSLCLSMFNITVCPESIYQLLSFVQNCLDDLKNMKPDDEKWEKEAGEVEIFEGGRKIGTKAIMVTEDEFLAGGGTNGRIQ